MKPFSGSIGVQEIYEALVPFKMEYPYKIVREDNQVEIKTELFPKIEEEKFITEAKKIEIGTSYKLRPVIIISKSEIEEVFLTLPLTKKQNITTKELDYVLEVCKDRIKERHFLFKKKYANILKFDSLVLIDNIHPLTRNNIYKPRGRLKDGDYITIQAKLKKILSPNPTP